MKTLIAVLALCLSAGAQLSNGTLIVHGWDDDGPKADTPVVVVYQELECASGSYVVPAILNNTYGVTGYASAECFSSHEAFHYLWFKSEHDAVKAANLQQLDVIGIFRTTKVPFTKSTKKVKIPQPDKEEEKTTYTLESPHAHH